MRGVVEVRNKDYNRGKDVQSENEYPNVGWYGRDQQSNPVGQQDKTAEFKF